MPAAIEPMGIAFSVWRPVAVTIQGSRATLVMKNFTVIRPYFGIRHTANDTLDKVDADLVRRNAAECAAGPIALRMRRAASTA